MEGKVDTAARLIERILLDAEAEAARTDAEAESAAGKIALVKENDLFEINRDAAARAARERESILERSRTNAALDSRKYALAAKRALVDRAFAAAAEKLASTGGAGRTALLETLLKREAEGGETVHCAPGDRESVADALQRANAALLETGRAALTLGEDAAGLGAGFILSGDGYEKNCSFDALLRDVRADAEAEVAAMLFT